MCQWEKRRTVQFSPANGRRRGKQIFDHTTTGKKEYKVFRQSIFEERRKAIF
jgi:hypothetical protein